MRMTMMMAIEQSCAGETTVEGRETQHQKQHLFDATTQTTAKKMIIVFRVQPKNLFFSFVVRRGVSRRTTTDWECFSGGAHTAPTLNFTPTRHPTSTKIPQGFANTINSSMKMHAHLMPDSSCPLRKGLVLAFLPLSSTCASPRVIL